MAAKIQPCPFTVQAAPVDAGFAGDPAKWLADQARAHHLEWLLAHSADGVTWGRLVDGVLQLSSNPFPAVSPGLHAETLQQVRLFGPQAELMVWRSAGGWQGRILSDGGEKPGWCYDESQWLWGDHSESARDGFTLVAEGQQGLRHAVPLTQIHFDPPERESERWNPLRLDVRQYLVRQKDGRLTVTQGRLTGLRSEPRKEASR